MNTSTDKTTRKYVQFSSFITVDNKLCARLSLWSKSLLKKEKNITFIASKSKTPLPFLSQSDSFVICKDESFCSKSHSFEIETNPKLEVFVELEQISAH